METTARHAPHLHREERTVTLTPLRETVDRLAEYARLPADWDSYGSPPVSGVALIEACRLLVAATERFGGRAGARIGPYHVAPIPGGGVLLEWRGRGVALEVHVGSDGALGWLLAEEQGGEERYREGRAADADEVLRRLGRSPRAGSNRTAPSRRSPTCATAGPIRRRPSTWPA
jgi:hypothetical protein